MGCHVVVVEKTIDQAGCLVFFLTERRNVDQLLQQVNGNMGRVFVQCLRLCDECSLRVVAAVCQQMGVLANQNFFYARLDSVECIF